jgi:hypothetical protein
MSYKVKPLEWDMSAWDEYGTITALTAFGDYFVMGGDGDPTVFQLEPTLMKGKSVGYEFEWLEAATREEAMNKCKEHYEKMLKGCLILEE